MGIEASARLRVGSVYLRSDVFIGCGDGSPVSIGRERNGRTTPASVGIERGAETAPADEQYFGIALALPSSSAADDQRPAVDHDESMEATDKHGDRGRISITSMRPCLHCGHWCNDMPVSSS